MQVTETEAGAAYRRVMIAVLCVGGGVIYGLPFLRQQFYLPLLQALRINNTQLGVMSGVYGFAAMLSYFPGGWLADRISAKKLLTFSFIATGLGGFYFAAYPPYAACLLLHLYWGITTALTFWPAMIKATRILSGCRNEGKYFGLMEGGRNLCGVLLAMLVLFIFSRIAGPGGLTAVILVYSVILIILGLLTGLFFSDAAVGSRRGALLEDIKKVVCYPQVWLIALVVLCFYISIAARSYVIACATQVYGGSVVFGGEISVGMQWVSAFATYFCGILASRVSTSKTIIYCLILLLASELIFILLPGQTGLIMVFSANALLMALAIFAMRGVYYGLLEETRIPLAITGITAGWISTVGYTPDVFAGVMAGALLDHFPGKLGYDYLFGVLALFAAVGLALILVWRRATANRRKEIYGQESGLLDLCRQLLHHPV